MSTHLETKVAVVVFVGGHSITANKCSANGRASIYTRLTHTRFQLDPPGCRPRNAQPGRKVNRWPAKDSCQRKHANYFSQVGRFGPLRLASRRNPVCNRASGKALPAMPWSTQRPPMGISFANAIAGHPYSNVSCQHCCYRPEMGQSSQKGQARRKCNSSMHKIFSERRCFCFHVF